jgi:[ribosomal protein S5]-alanine N-acetyltransferase
LQMGLIPNEFYIKSEYMDFTTGFTESLKTHVLPSVINNPDSYLLHTHRMVVDTTTNTCVGGIGFLIKDNLAHTGYFTFAAYEGKGCAAAALGLLVQWLWQNTKVTTVEATIPNGHTASEKVVQKNGFIKTATGNINTFSLCKP